jgi:hypothetical protein
VRGSNESAASTPSPLGSTLAASPARREAKIRKPQP